MIYFGELTFYPEASFEKFEPDSYDETLGSWLILPKEGASLCRIY
jgi:hypothetical protein